MLRTHLTVSLFALFILLVPLSSTHATTVTLQDGISGYSGTSDTFIDVYASTINSGNSETLILGGYGNQKPLIRFDLSSIPSNATITAATISVYAMSFAANGGGNSTELTRLLSRDWNELKATWVQYAPSSPWSATGLSRGKDYGTKPDSIALSGYTPSNVWITFDVKALVQMWVNGSVANSGIVLTDGNGGPRYDIASSENANTTLRPKLIIEYSVPETPGDTASPSVPDNLTAVPVSTSQINLSWGASTDNTGVAGYKVNRGGNLVATVGNVLTYQDTNLQAGTTYSYTVQAFDAAGNVSSLSAIVSTATMSDVLPPPPPDPTKDTTAPSAPTNLIATPVGSSQVNLSWGASTDNVGLVGYHLYRNGNPLTTATITNYTDSGLTAATQYNYEIDAFDAAGNTSNKASVTILTPPLTSPGTYTVGARIQTTVTRLNVRTGAGKTNSILCTSPMGNLGTILEGPRAVSSHLWWRVDFDSGCDGWVVQDYLKIVTAPLPQLPTVTLAANPTSITVGQSSTLSWSSTSSTNCVGTNVLLSGTEGQVKVTPTTTTTYVVSCSGVEGTASTSVTVTVIPSTPSPSDTIPPTIPANLTATPVSSAQINLSWGASTDNTGVAGYKVNRGGNLVATVGNVLTYQDTNLQAGTTYSYTVQAFDAAGNASVVSGSVSATTQGVPNPSSYSVYYISPVGSDTANGLSASSPVKTFKKAFSLVKAGDELVLLDGTYGEAQGTGYISYLGTNSAQIPSGTQTKSTYVHAQNPGAVTVNGNLFIGRSTANGGKASYIKVQGITFEGGGNLYNTSFVTVKDSGFHGEFDIGTNDGDWGNTDNLIEDCWIWASGARIIAANYRAHRNVWRRVIIRGDGCGTSACSGTGNPNVGITVYNSHEVSLQNVMVVDRILAPTDELYSDFASAQHDPGPKFSNKAIDYVGNDEWLGTISLHAPDTGFYLEPDTTFDPTYRVVNAISWNAKGGGFNLSRAGTNSKLENITVYEPGGNDGIRVAPELTTGYVRNALVTGNGRYAINSVYGASYVNMSGTWQSLTNQGPVTNTVSGDPRANGAFKYLTRVEPGSALSGKGYGGADIGANVLYRYGTDGSRYGEGGYNTLTATSLWPWPNEARIKKEMCNSTTRGFCSSGKQLDGIHPITFTSYVWETLGNPLPSSIASASPVVSPTASSALAVVEASPFFTRDLAVGTYGDDVRELQKFLNTHGFSVAPTGDGSSGNETNYFGQATLQALKKFQTANVLYASSTGYLGELTRMLINNLRR